MKLQECSENAKPP